MVTKEVIKDIGVYNEYWDRIGAEDHYWLYLISEKYEVSNLNEVLYYYRHNPQSVTRNKTNPRKIHCHDFLFFFFNQRKETETDYIETGNHSAIKEMENKFLTPYLKDSTFIYKRLVDWAYSDQDFKAVFKLIFKAIKTKPLSIYWYKSLFYYARKYFA